MGEGGKYRCLRVLKMNGKKKSNNVFIKVFAEATVKQESFVCQPSSAGRTVKTAR